ncbi:MAG: molybdate ABC transporter permease subunit [Myxococcota bacterium]|nr:molybdate ABC transporter permease subunit [Myxococcota bacterium]
MMNLDAGHLEAIQLSLFVSIASTILVLPVAITTAWLLAQTQFVGKSIVEAFVTMPLVLPPVVTGYFLLIIMGRTGLFGRYLWDAFGIQLSFSWYGAALASAIVSFPLAVRSIRQSFEAINPQYDQVAQTLGVSRSRRFLTLHLPLAMPGIIGGSLLAFARSLGEFGATITFVGNIPGETRTIPLAIYSNLQRPNGETESIILVVCSVILSIAAVVMSEVYLSMKRTSI